MSASLLRRPRFWLPFLLWAAIAAAAMGGIWLLWSQHEAAVEDLLERHRLVQELSWEAIHRHKGSSVDAYLRRYVVNAEVLRLLARAQAPERRPAARQDLQRQLAEAADYLREQGVDFVHFHLPDGTSFLRLHQPDLHGDLLVDGRASVRLVQELRQPVSGFEVDPTGFGHRNVFPIFDDAGQYLGSVELSVHYPLLLQEIEALWPDRRFELLVKREVVGAVLVEPDKADLSPWPGSPQFMVAQWQVEDRPTPEVADAARSVAAKAELQSRIAAAAPDAFRLRHAGRDLAILQTPLVDPAGQAIGLLLSYVPEPALARLDTRFRFNAATSVSVILMLGLVSHWLMMVMADKAGERQRLGLITRSLGQGLYVLDAKGVITEVNPRACLLLGYQSHELIGKRAHDIFHLREDNGFGAGDNGPIEGAAARGERYAGEQRFRRKDGCQLHVAVTSVPMLGEAGSVTLFDDVTRQKIQEGQLKRIAHFDALTGLANRVLLADRMAVAMARTRRSGSGLALAFIDLDGFKAVNDNHGHDVGDRLLIRLGRRMQAVVRDTDTVARLGGDEFAVVLADISDSASYAPMVERLLEALGQPELIDGNTVQVSASIGVSLYPQDEEVDADQLLRQADQAMYEAKLAGKGRYRVFDLDHHADLRGRHRRVERLRSAIKDGELKLYYQPCVNLQTGALDAVEALLRWQHPEHGLLAPAAFMPLIRRHELEVEIGRWVLQAALQQADFWRRKGLRVAISVNIAGEHLQHPDFAAQLATALAAQPAVQASQLHLEVVESSALENLEESCRVIEACSALGVRVALDDFGTGYSSLSYLKRLPVQILKLDRSFVRDMMDDPEDLAIVDGVLNLARAFDLRAVAEGVETLAHGRMLKQLGCEYAQGYAIARPMPPSGLEQWLKGWSLPAEWVGVTPVLGETRDLLYGLVEHRAWLLSLREHLEDPTTARPARVSQCPLNQRLESAFRRWGDKPLRRSLIAVHDRVHQLAEELIVLAQAQDRHEALARWREIELVSRELQALLERMSRMGAAPRRPQS